jgi:hypothetical protein
MTGAPPFPPASANAGVIMKAVTLLAGGGMVLVPALAHSSWAQAAVAVGLLGVVASLWRVLSWAGLVAVTAAIASCAISRPSTLPLAGEGLLILGYLLLLDIPCAIPRQARHGGPASNSRWHLPGWLPAARCWLA